MTDNRPLPERIRTMYFMYGLNKDEICKDCIHLIRYKMGASWLKCDLTIQTGGKGTDWRANWQACGKFEKREEKSG